MGNIETVKSMYEAFSRGDIPFIIDQLADDVQWEEGGADHGIPWLVPGTGQAHAIGFFQELADFEFHRFEVEAVVGDGDLVVGVCHVDVTVKSTGGHFAGIELHVWRFNADGKVRAFSHVLDTIDHLAAATKSLQSA